MIYNKKMSICALFEFIYSETSTSSRYVLHFPEEVNVFFVCIFVSLEFAIVLLRFPEMS